MNKIIAAIFFLVIFTNLKAQEDLSNQYAAEGWGFVNKKQYTEALAAFDKSVSAFPSSFGGILGRGFTYIELNMHAQAIADFQKLESLYPKNPYPSLMMGWDYLLQQKFADAKVFVLKTYKMDPFFFNGVSNMGNYYFLTGNDALAQKYYLEALACIKNAPDFDTFFGDLDRFIEKGWRVEQAKKIKAFLQNEINTNKEKYIEIAAIDLKSIAFYNEQKDIDAIGENRKALNLALTLSPPNYYLAMRNSYLIGSSYDYLNKKQEAENAYIEAVGYIKKGNLVTPTAAEASNYAGLNYKDKRNYSEALNCYLLALDIHQKLEDETGIAILCSNIGEVYMYLGNKKKAIEYLDRAIALDTKNKRNEGLAYAFNNIGAVYKDLGELKKADDYYDKAIAIVSTNYFKGQSLFYNMKGNLCIIMGNNQQALELFTKAYSIDEKEGNRLLMGRRLSSMGVCYQNLGQLDKSIEVLNQSKSISESENDFGTLGLTYNSLGAGYMSKKEYTTAKEYYEKSLAITRNLNDRTTIASTLINLAEIYTVYSFDAQKAQSYLKEAEGIFRQLNMKNELSKALNALGGLGIAVASYNNDLTQLDNSVNYYKEAIAIKEELRQNLQGDQRVKFMADIIYTYELLTASYLFMGKYSDAFNTLEISRAKSLSEKLSSKSSVVPVTIAQVQASLSDKAVILYFANTVQNPMSLIAITKNSVTGYQIKKDNLIDVVNPQYGAQIVNVVNNQRGFKRIDDQANQNAVPLNTEQLKKKNLIEDIINFYRTLLIDPNSSEKQQVASILATNLYKFLLSPAESQLVGKSELFIVADGILAYLPFETLKDASNKFLIEDFDVRYLHSLTVLDLIKKRVYPVTRKSMLAFGGANYEKYTTSSTLIKSANDLYPLQKEVNKIVASKGSLRNAYSSLGISGWNYLPGTLSEVKNIQSIIPDARLLIADDCSEKNLKNMSSVGELAGFKTIHFATHGLVVPEIPALSAIILSLKSTPVDNEDGYLTMNEIESLKLNADFVNLSACETGLGKIYGGEGVVGLSQSFLIAGANGLSVSLWQVADESTSRFMVGMYQSQKENPTISYSQAICKMKRQFISGSFGEEMKKPFYWAPFIYYGK